MKIQTRAGFGILLVAIGVCGSLTVLRADSSWPLTAMLSDNFAHRNSLLKLIGQGQSWKSLFVDRFNVIGSNEIFGAPTSQEESTGLGASDLSPSVVETEPGANGMDRGGWNFGLQISWYLNNLADMNQCIFEVGNCLRKFISTSVSNLELYNRCTIDPYQEFSTFAYDDGLKVNSFLNNLRPIYADLENQLLDVNGKLADAKDTKGDSSPEANALELKRASLQEQLERMSKMAWDTRKPLAAKVLTQYLTLKPDSHTEGCEKINRLLGVALLDPDAYESQGVSKVVFAEMRTEGLIFEFSAQLASYVAGIEKKNGLAAVMKSDEIREYRRQQLELYANYSLVRQGPKATFNPWGFLYQVDLSQGRSVKKGATLDEELVFLLESFHRDYPGFAPKFTLLDSNRSVTDSELARMLVEKNANYEKDIQETNEFIKRRNE